MKKYQKILSGVRIPNWALCSLVNSNARKTVDEWVERTRNGGRIDVCPWSDAEPYFTEYPAFGPACDVEDCDVIVDMTPRYQHNLCRRFGQSRFGPSKRTALDGKVWWCLYDYKDHAYVTGYRCRTRKQVLVRLARDLQSTMLPYEPDPRFSLGWLMTRTAPEIVDLVDKQEPAWLEKSLDDTRPSTTRTAGR